MSTQCFIGILINNNVKCISCHWDGYLSYMGPMLQLGYTTAEKAEALVNLGDICYIGYNINIPRQFKDIDELEQHHEYYQRHFKTSFVVSYIRDMFCDPKEFQAKFCTLQRFCEVTNYGYIYDLDRNCWLVTVNNCKPVSLEKVLTDKNYYEKLQKVTECYDTWEDIRACYSKFKLDLLCKGSHTIIGKYNAWLAIEPKGRGITFDYAVRNGVRMYALMPVRKETNKRRKVLLCSPYIGDLVACVCEGKAQQLLQKL